MTQPVPQTEKAVVHLARLLFVVAALVMLMGCKPAMPDPAITRVSTRPALARVTLAPVMEPTALPRRTARPSATATITATHTPAATAIPASPTPSPTYDSHIVQAEDTLLGIAARYAVGVEALVEANGLGNPNFLQEGQELRIPPSQDVPAPALLPDRDYGYAIIGFSAGGRAIEVFSFGDGPNHVVFVGGIHGGAEWNTVLLAHEVIDYFNAYRDDIPAGVTIDIIPVANPDGLYLVTGSAGRFSPAQVTEPTQRGRFNARGVDLNRNWDCTWSATARWGGRTVDPGSGPFSEPETRALRDYLEGLSPHAVVFWHSMANLVAPGSCEGDAAGSGLLAATYGEAAGYPVGPFTAYEISGDASSWLAGQGIPAVVVELASKDESESGKNLAGVLAVLALSNE